MNIRHLILCIILLGSAFTSFAATAAEPSASDFKNQVLPVLKKLCINCHGPDKQESDLRIDKLNPDLVTGADAETWHDILNKINLGKMPPAKASPLEGSERSVVIDWLTSELRRAVEARRSTGGRVVLRRLNRYEYQNTMSDLLGVDLNYAADLPPESVSAEGFQNNGAALGISPLQLEFYLAAARRGLSQAIVTGEAPKVFELYRKVPPPPEVDAQATDKKKGNNKAGTSSLLLAQAGSFYQLKADQFPREGEVLVRVTAVARLVPEQGYPRLQVALGVKADTQSPEKALGEADVTGTEEQPQTLEFRGRIEEFPLPGHNPKFPGLLINVRNVHGSPNGSGGGKNKNGKSNAAENLPSILLKSVEFVGPIYTSWPPPSHTQILPARSAELSEGDYLTAVLQKFLRRAYRRPVQAADIDVMRAYYRKLRPQAESFEAAIRETLAMALISPDFLYLVEPRQDEKTRHPLTDHELAARLSYFLTSSMPDETLAELADARKLRDRNVLVREVERLLAQPQSWQLITHFTDQWLDLNGMTRVAVNPQFYPQFNDALKADLRSETHQLFATVLRENLSALNLLAADFAMLNYPLAQHYGLSGPRGQAFERVALSADDHRGGLLTQGSFLLATSNGEDSHPIKRAVWLLDRLLDDPPAPPPPDVPELDSKKANVAKLSLKERLEAHRESAACNNCHRGIDPWGIPFENYDAVGQWRNKVGGKGRAPTTVDASTTLPDGTQLTGLTELKQHLLKNHREQFARALVKRMLSYALGRSLEFADTVTIDELTSQFAKDDYRLSRLIAAIVTSEPFLTK